MPLNPLNSHYSIENTATIYDEEAMTALQLAARTTAKVNETVEAFNQLETETGDHLQTQDEQITIMNNVTMPAKVDETVKNHIKNGTFREDIDNSLGGLNARVDNLLSKVNEGATTRDAEVIDGRTSVEGYATNNLGGAIRTAEALARLGIHVDDFELENISGTLTEGEFLKADGTTAAASNYNILTIPVNPGEVYFIQSLYGYDCVEACVFDSTGALIGHYHNSPSAMAENIYEVPIVIPTNGATLKISSGVGNDSMDKKYPTAKRVVGRSFNNRTANTSVMNIVDLILTGYGAKTENITGTITAGGILSRPLLMQVMTTSADKYYAGKYPVTPGELIRIKGSANYGNAVYTFEDEGRVVDTVTAATYTVIDDFVIVPPGSKMLWVACQDSTEPIVARVTGVEVNPAGWGNLKWYCMGDSLTERNTRTDVSYHDYVAGKTSIQVINGGISGTGYKNPADADKAFYQRITSIPADVDVITIFGSGNDLGYTLGSVTDTGTDTVCGCINTTIDTIRATYPTAQLGVVSPTPWQHNEPGDNGTMAQYANALAEICKRKSVPFLDLFRCSGLHPNDSAFREVAYSKDDGNGVHPDETGHKMIAGQFYTFLQSLIGIY